MRTSNIAAAALALRASSDRAPQARRRLAAEAGEADAARVASLWPAPARQCAAPVYLELPAPAMFGMLFQVSWPAQPRALGLRRRQCGPMAA